jgi:hypothetical protein
MLRLQKIFMHCRLRRAELRQTSPETVMGVE